MQLSEMSIRRPVMTTMLTATIIALGIFGYRLLPVSALPKVDFPTIATLPVSERFSLSPGIEAITLATPLFTASCRSGSTRCGTPSMT